MKSVFKVGDHVNIHLSTGDRIDGEVVSVTDEFVELLQPKAYREEQPTVFVNLSHITHVYLNGYR